MDKKSVLLTIDTEGHEGNNPISSLIFGHTIDGDYGIVHMMKEFDKVNAKGLFFVDFAECWDFGEERIKEVVDTILKHGHDVGVHIHPDHMADKTRLFLYEYDYEEQYHMIRKCTKMYYKLVGKAPLSFRAGKYSANHDTLDVLQKLGYWYDFSEFYHQKWCGIHPPITINAPVKYGSLVEFPVTMHKMVSIGSFKLECKLDIEQMRTQELCYALNQAKKQKFPVVMTLFIHSFSLLDWRKNPDTPHRSNENISKLKYVLHHILYDRNLEFISESDLNQITPVDQETAMKSEIEWKSNLRGLYYLYFKAKMIYRTNSKAKLYVWFIRGGMMVMFLCVMIFMYLAIK